MMSDAADDVGWIAHHEAGHAIVALRLDVVFDRVSIVPDATTAGRVVHGFGDLRIPTDKWRFEPGVEPELVRGELRQWLAISTAGREANAMRDVKDEYRRVFGEPWPADQLEHLSREDAWLRSEWTEELDRGQQNDLLAHLELEDFGFNRTDWWRLARVKEGLRREGRQLARRTLESHWQSVARLAEALFVHRELSYDDVLAVVR